VATSPASRQVEETPLAARVNVPSSTGAIAASSLVRDSVSYSDVAGLSPSSGPPVNRVRWTPPRPRDVAATQCDVLILHVRLPAEMTAPRLRQIREWLGTKGMNRHMLNVSLLGSQYAELIFNVDRGEGWAIEARAAELEVKTDLDPSDVEQGDSATWIPDRVTPQKIKTVFLQHARHEMQSAYNGKAKQFYRQWLSLTGWDEGTPQGAS
jgi:hypothetical protein